MPDGFSQRAGIMKARWQEAPRKVELHGQLTDLREGREEALSPNVRGQLPLPSLGSDDLSQRRRQAVEQMPADAVAKPGRRRGPEAPGCEERWDIRFPVDRQSVTNRDERQTESVGDRASGNRYLVDQERLDTRRRQRIRARLQKRDRLLLHPFDSAAKGGEAVHPAEPFVDVVEGRRSDAMRTEGSKAESARRDDRLDVGSAEQSDVVATSLHLLAESAHWIEVSDGGRTDDPEMCHLSLADGQAPTDQQSSSQAAGRAKLASHFRMRRTWLPSRTRGRSAGRPAPWRSLALTRGGSVSRSR